MKGTLLECFRHYVSTLPTGSDAVVGLGRKPLVNFLRCNSDTIRDWINGRPMMGGVVTIKLAHFLETIGYEVNELVEMKTTSLMSYHIGEVLAFTGQTLDDVAKFIGYEDVNSILRIVRGKQNPTGDRATAVTDLWKKFRKEVEDQRAQLREALNIEKPAQKKETSSDPGVITALAGLIGAITPLAELVASEKFTAEDRRKLRELTGGDGMFKLSNAVMMLCGESARNDFLSKKRR